MALVGPARLAPAPRRAPSARGGGAAGRIRHAGWIRHAARAKGGGGGGGGEDAGGFIGALLEPVDARMPSAPAAQLSNADLLPTTEESRTFSSLDLAALWVGIVVCVPAYFLAASLIELGMTWVQAVATVLCANLVVLLPMVLNGHVGTKFGIPFPVAARAAFGVYGANVPALLRAAVATGWFGIQTWVGGEAVGALMQAAAEAVGMASVSAALAAPAPAVFAGITCAEVMGFVAFWVLQVGVIVRGIESIKWLERLTAPVLIGLVGSLLLWAATACGGLGAALGATATMGLGSSTGFWGVFWPALTANVAFWATLSLNIPDFTRFARSQRAQLAGQAMGLPLSMAALSFVGVAATGASVALFGHVVSDPVQLVRSVGGAGGAQCVALVGLLIATLSTNIAANVVSPAYALVAAAPRRLTFASAGLLTAFAGAVLQPWRLVSSTQGFIFTWLIGSAALLGPVAGVMIVDYWILRRRQLDVDSLYSLDTSAAYHYSNGYNIRAMMALAVGAAPSMPGFLVAANLVPKAAVPSALLAPYDHAWALGFAMAAILYLGLTAAFPVRGGGQRKAMLPVET